MLVIILVIVFISSWLQPEIVTDEMLETRVLDVVDRLLARTQFSLFPFLPSYWVSSGITQWIEGAVMGALFFGLVLLSHTLFFGYIATTKSGSMFFSSLSAVNSRGRKASLWRIPNTKKNGQLDFKPKLLDRLAKLFWWWSKSDSRALIPKDTLTFWRDTTQWGQSLFPFLPSYWVSSGITQWIEGAVMGALFFGLVLLSHTLFFGYIATTKSGSMFFSSLSAVNSRGRKASLWRIPNTKKNGQLDFKPKLLDRLAKLFWWWSKSFGLKSN
jgi:hypothetical protein